MARNINDRLKQLDTRRKGTDRLGRVASAAANEVLAKSRIQESWQKRAKTQPHTQYALGAMQAVEASYTEISLETAGRVGRQLNDGLPAHGVYVDFDLQGSVPLDVHIRGVSDVDLLVLDSSFYTYDTSGARSRAGQYTSPTSKTSVGVLSAIRNASIKVLKAAYPAATVETSGAKCIAISGGSLARPVDVVPSHWYDTMAYQSSMQKHDRGVTILNSKTLQTIDNLPFLHIHRMNERDSTALGGVKKAVRLTKNVKNDAEDESRAAKLPSFDVAALMYHADQSALIIGYLYELRILQETQRFLDWCWNNKAQSQQLMTPDGSRRILDTSEKMDGLAEISHEMDNLVKEVAKEQNPALLFVDPSPQQIAAAIATVTVPAAS